MTSTPHSETPLVAHDFIAQRKAGTGAPRAQALFRIVQAISEGLSVSPLHYSAGGPRLTEFSESAIETWLTKIDQMHRNGKYVACGLANRGRGPMIDLFYRSYEIPFGTEEIEFYLPPSIQSTQIELLVSTIEQICVEFGAFYAYTRNDKLQSLHGRKQRMYQLDLASRRPEEHSRIPKPMLVDGVVDTLPPLLYREEFDRVQVPEGVWWINFWTPTQIENVGVERVRNAGWSRIIERPEGFLLVATDEPTSVYNPAHLAKLGELVEALNLKEVQEQHRVRYFNMRD